jgi:hypothetical protein
MAGMRHEGPLCRTRGERIDSGTLCRNKTSPPVPLGLDLRAGAAWLTETAMDMESEVSEFFDGCMTSVSNDTKSALISILDVTRLKPDSPYSTQLLKHYVEQSGAAYELKDIPEDWQAWIVKRTGGRPGTYKALNPYNSGIYDLRNALGHFDVTVVAKNKSKIYTITDLYEFGYQRGDTQQRGRHGFPLGRLSDYTVATIKWLLPADEYRNPGGFTERWEVNTAGGETILHIPQVVLAEQGRSFRVTGTFTR